MRLHVPSKKGTISKIKIETEIDEIGYELRSNPKQSWRLSHGKQGIVSCQECGEEFPSSKMLSSHMRTHSDLHHCEKCGKGFNSDRAMFGHMKTHSKKFSHNRPDEDESLSCLVANLCPVRRKRSRIKYNVVPNASFSSLNESVLDEEAEMHMAAVSLIMLLRGVTDWRDLPDEDLDFGNELKVGSEVVETEGLVESTDDKVGLELLKSDSGKGKAVLGSDSDSESSTYSEDDNDDDGMVDFRKKRKCYGSMNVITNFYQSGLKITQLGCSSVVQ